MEIKPTIDVSLLRPTDAWKLCDFMVTNETRLKKYLPLTLNRNLNPTLSQIFVADKLKLIEREEEFLYTLKLKSSRQLIGLIYLKNIDRNKGQGEFAYAIDYRYQGQGIIPSAVYYLMAQLHSLLGLQHYQIIANKDNPASIRVAEKCGFKWTKTLEREFEPPGKPAKDMELYELSI